MYHLCHSREGIARLPGHVYACVGSISWYEHTFIKFVIFASMCVHTCIVLVCVYVFEVLVRKHLYSDGI